MIFSTTELMRRYPTDVDVNSVACKTLSNLAINSHNIPLVAEAEGPQAILDAMMSHPDDANLQWLGCSALWNIAQNQEQRVAIGDMGGVNVIVGALTNHTSSALVQETAIGALANLSVAAQYKLTVEKYIQLVYSAMDLHLDKHQVQTSACGLITNLAHSEDIAGRLGTTHAVERVMQAMIQYPKERHLQRNAAAALSNLSGTEDNVSLLIRNRSAEYLYSALENFHTHDNVTTLATRALRNIGIREGEGRTTSLHLAARAFGYGSQFLMTELLTREQIHIDVQDGEGDSVLHHATRRGFSYRIIWLVARGANPRLKNKHGFSPMDLAKGRSDGDILLQSFGRGERDLSYVYDQFVSAMTKSTPTEFYSDLNTEVVSFLSPVEMHDLLTETESEVLTHQGAEWQTHPTYLEEA